MTQNVSKKKECTICGSTKWYIMISPQLIEYLCIRCTGKAKVRTSMKQAAKDMTDKYICMLICTRHNSQVRQGTSDSQTLLHVQDITQSQINAYRERIQLKRSKPKKSAAQESAELSDSYVRSIICALTVSRNRGLKPEDISQERVDMYRQRLQWKRQHRKRK